MAISKLILNGETQMDVTSNTNTSNNMLNGVVGTKNDGTTVTGSIAIKTSSDLTASGATVTAPAGYYSTTATKSIGAGSAFPPAVTITKAPTIGVNTSGVVTASYNGSSSITPTVTSGYVSQGTAGTISTTGTSTYQLTSKAAATYYPSTADQTIASQRWLVGNQTIKSVTTSNLTAANIAEGVVVQVGDSANASRITQVTGTLANASYYGIYKTLVDTGTIYSSGSSTYNYTSTDVSNWCDTFSSFRFGQFEDMSLWGNFTFNNVTSIAEQAFTWTLGGYNNITSLTFPKASEIHRFCFENNTGLTTFIAPMCQSIYACAFSFCSNLTTVSLPNCNIIGSSAFYSCGFSSISLPSCTSIQANAFYSCRYLQSIFIPNIQSIESGAFMYCALKTFSLPSTITRIERETFYMCKQLKTIFMPNVSYIDGLYTFDSCAVLSTICAPQLQFIGSSTFRYCYYLSEINFPEVTYISASAFYSCSRLSSVNLPKVQEIRNNVFIGCPISSLNLPELNSYYYFSECHSLTYVNLPKATSVPNGAFYNCYNLSEVRLGPISHIDGYAFYRCYNLISLNLTLVSSVPLISSTVLATFSSTPLYNYSTSAGQYGSIYVPASLYNDFITSTKWSAISSRIVSV